MNKLNLKWLPYLFLLLIVSSCSDENPDTDPIEDVDTDRGNDGDADNTANIEDNSSDLVQSYNEQLLEMERYTTGMRPNASARALAYINLAAYETAVPAMDNYSTNTLHLSGFTLDESLLEEDISYPLAISTAYAKTIDHFFINLPDDQRNSLTEFEEDQYDNLTRRMSDTEIENSMAWGNHVADQVIAYSLTDIEAETQITRPQPRSYVPPTGDGFWTFSAEEERALFPYWSSVRTFVASTDETTTIAPIPYSEDPDSEYFAQMQEVNDVNNAAREDAGEDLWIAEFWSDDVEGLMMSPPARQISIANQLIDDEGLRLGEALYLMLKVGFVLNDAAVSTWKYKYEHMVMRPNVFIHEFIDDSFQTNLFRLVFWPNPSFPGYPSGHSTFATAAAGVFIDFFGDNTRFTDRTHEGRTEFLGEPRSYRTLSEMAEENAFSRIPLGVHVRMDCTEGSRLGYEIADLINAYDLKQ